MSSSTLSERTELVRAGGALALPEAPPLDHQGEAELRTALERLEAGRGLLVRVADLLGGAMGRATRLGARGLGIAPQLQDRLRGVAEAALARAYDVAILGMAPAPPSPTAGPGLPGSTRRIISTARRTGTGLVAQGPLGRAAVMASGAIGGFAGMGGFLPDASFTTLAIMRAIAGIAREHGEDLSTPQARRACLEVFALRTTLSEDGGSEAGYFSARLVMQGRPMMLLLSEVGARYGISLSQKFALQLVPRGRRPVRRRPERRLPHPLLRHVARAHFTIRRLERLHGTTAIREAANAIRASLDRHLPTT